MVLVFFNLIPLEVQTVFELILDRIEWMNENNIHQWNETNYTDAYPLS